MKTDRQAAAGYGLARINGGEGMKEKILKKAAVLVSCAGVLAVPASCVSGPAMAEQIQPRDSMQQESGVVEISVEYSDDIKPAEGDQFIITYAPEDDLAKTSSITVNAYAYEGDIMRAEVPLGTYQILNVEYQGNNDEIIKQGYAVTRGFYCSSGIPGTASIGAGVQQVSQLASSYGEGRLRIKDSDHSETGEASKVKYGTKYESKDTPAGEAQPDQQGQGSSGESVKDSDTASDSEGNGLENDKTLSDNYGEVDAPVTDTGEGKTIIYGDELKENMENKKDDNKNKTASSIAGKFVGLVLFAAVGFGAIFFLHKSGKF